MEPLVLFGAALVIYCGYIAVTDELRGWRRARGRSPATGPQPAKREKAGVPFSVRGRAGGAGGRWPAPLGGSA